MSPETIKTVIVAVFAVLIFAAGWAVEGWRKNAEIDRLERVRGLDMSAVTSEFDQGLRALVMDATAATVDTRNTKFGVSDCTQGLSPVIGFERRLAEAARPATPQPAAEQMDALRPMIDGVLEGRFVIKKVLGHAVGTGTSGLAPRVLGHGRQVPG